jgi:hypothetical protein
VYVGVTVASSVVATSWTVSVKPREWCAVSHQTVILSLMGTLVMVGTGDHTPLVFPTLLPNQPPFKPSVYVLQTSCGWFKTYVATCNYHYVCFRILQGLQLKTESTCSASNGLALPRTV